MGKNIFPNPISDWYDRNEKRVFTMPEVMALVDEMSISSGATRETIDYMDREYADNDTYVWKGPHMADKCPYCNYEAADVHDEIAHMEAEHPEIIRQRLEQAGITEHDKLLGGYGELRTENTRLRELYENVVNNRERFGWTINHLLECDEALRCVEAEVEELREAIFRVNVDWDKVARTCEDPKCAGDCRWVEVLRKNGALEP